MAIVKRGAMILVLGLGLSCVACNKETPSSGSGTTGSSAAPATAAAGAADGKKVYAEKCVVCHGEKGDGTGPGAAALTPKPRDFRDAAWQGSVTDEQLEKTILGGGAAVGKSPIMPGAPDLKGKDATLKDLIKVIRGFKG